MLKLFIKVVYLVCGLWGGHRRVDYMWASVGLDDVWFCHLFGRFCGDDPEWRGHHF